MERVSDEMVTVTREEFFAVVGPLNVTPCTHDPNVTIWEFVQTRQVVGHSYPGWRNAGLPGHPKKYELRKSIVDRSTT